MSSSYSLKILRGINLLAQDFNLMSAPSSDPYCEVYVDGKQIGRTPVQYQTLNPVWGGPLSTYRLCNSGGYSINELTQITIKLYDYDYMKSDDPMGVCTFCALEILGKADETNYPNVWVNVEAPTSTSTGSGDEDEGDERRDAPTTSCIDCDSDFCGKLEVRLIKIDENDSSLCTSVNMDEKNANTPPPKKQQSIAPNIYAGPKLYRHSHQSVKYMIKQSTSPVTLHVYDVSHNEKIGMTNVVTKALNVGGIFHGAIEIHGKEYSFGGSRLKKTGIFTCKPRNCPMHEYRESLYLGDCELTIEKVEQIVSKMKPEWMAPTYDLLRKNCCFFAKEFAIELGVGSIPEWVYSLADLGAALSDYLYAREEKESQRKLKVVGMPTTTNTSKSDNITCNKKEMKAKITESKKQQQQTPTNQKSSGTGCKKEKTKRKKVLIVDGDERLPPPPACDNNSKTNENDMAIFVNNHESMLDNVMASRVQRAFRSTRMVNRSSKLTISTTPRRPKINTEKKFLVPVVPEKNDTDTTISYGQSIDPTRASYRNIEVSCTVDNDDSDQDHDVTNTSSSSTTENDNDWDNIDQLQNDSSFDKKELNISNMSSGAKKIIAPIRSKTKKMQKAFQNLMSRTTSPRNKDKDTE